MYGTILAFNKLNNFGTWRLNGPRRLFYSFCCTTRHIFEPLCVYEPGFNTDKYGNNFNCIMCIIEQLVFITLYTYSLRYSLC